MLNVERIRSPRGRSGGTYVKGREKEEQIFGLELVAWAGRILAMDSNTLFTQALGLGDKWKVVNSQMDIENRELRLTLDFMAGTKFTCPKCKQLCAVYDTENKEWRHLDFWQHRTRLQARVPRVSCSEHGVLQTEVPWARAGSGFTLMMEGMILLLAEQMSVAAAARLLRTTDKRLWRVIDHYVMAAHRGKDWSKVQKILVDETSSRRGHRYVTNVIDAESKDLLMMIKDRGTEALGEFASAMFDHEAKPEQITAVVMDMSPAYIAGTAKYFSKARVVFDAFHIMQMAGKALDDVRKELARKGEDMRGALWALRGNAWTRTEKHKQRRDQLIATYPKLGRAIMLRELLQDVLAGNEHERLYDWLAWADRSRLSPFQALSKTLKRHLDGVLAYMETRLSNGVMEAVNGLLQLAKRIARGFRNFYYFRLAAYLKVGGLNLKTPHLLPT